MEIVTLFVMIPVLFWYAYTVSEPKRTQRWLRGRELAELSEQAVRLPPRRRFPRPRPRPQRTEIQVWPPPTRRSPLLAPSPLHPMWDRWIDG